jgi:hypothetical protein
VKSVAEIRASLACILADVQVKVRDSLRHMPPNGTPSRSEAFKRYRKDLQLAVALTTALEDYT